MQHITEVIREIDPLQFDDSFHEYNDVIQEMYTQFLKEKDRKFKKYIVFEAFQKLFWEGACMDLKCSQISDKINERIKIFGTEYNNPIINLLREICNDKDSHIDGKYL
jgi:hypothetical protein